MRVSILLLALGSSHAHVALELPFPRTKTCSSYPGQCSQGSCFWFSQGCQPGCTNCTDGFENDGSCAKELEPTVKGSAYRTYQDVRGYDWTKHYPWRSPGRAPVFSPCGLAGGGVTNHPSNGATAKHIRPAVSQGQDGRLLPAAASPAVWARGSTQQVGWSITANHGGGYAYRLCAKTGVLEEACFQAGHLAFAKNHSWIQRGTDRQQIAAKRLSTGTHPLGSEWSMNPIPACSGTSGGVGQGFNCSGAPPQFAPPLPGLYGYGTAECFEALGGSCTDAQRKELDAFFAFSIVDEVLVPASLPPGEYLLSFRYDAEQTPQVWANCADVRITPSAGEVPAPVEAA